MVGSTLVLLAATVLPMQEATAQVAAEADAPAIEISGSPIRPADFVAERVRTILRNSDDAQAWSELAEGLPEMAISGDADLLSTFEAAALAESYLPTPSGTVATEAAPSLIDWSGTTPFQIGALVALLIAATFMGVRALRRRPRRRARSGRTRKKPSPTLRPASLRAPTATPIMQARQLAASGIAIPEIAQRTGMARDAISILVGLQSR